ncbi:hypothetical protein ACFVSN_30310 [Kitasatospora sp. NPDC057904]|uniref:hypothetical protein n=1 Tax=unclassified Kitasatospora TaxID=2633591 RepID=UPI0036D8B02D
MLVNITPDGCLHDVEGDYSAGRWGGWRGLCAAGVKQVTSAATGSTNHVLAAAQHRAGDGGGPGPAPMVIMTHP